MIDIYVKHQYTWDKAEEIQIIEAEENINDFDEEDNTDDEEI